MHEIHFTKMHGLGNNYIYLDAKKQLIDEKHLSQLAKALSCVNTGIGSDGLILITPPSSPTADVRMRIFNRDGSEGKNCGNGIRCVAKYAYENDYTSSKTMKIETLSGVVHATITEQSTTRTLVSVNMGSPRLSRSQIPMVGPETSHIVSEPFLINDQTLLLTAVSMGNPHAVFFVSDISLSPHLTLGPLIEIDSRFPERVNVEFISVKSAREIDFRVWERGSGPTAACGTGACAAVVACILNGYCRRDEEVTVHLPGGDLQIEWTTQGHILMNGPAETIATGTFFQKENENVDYINILH